MVPDCLFCSIVRREIPSTVVFENDDVLAFHDINPAAPVHILVVPKKHCDNIMDPALSDGSLFKALFQAVQSIAKQEGLTNGFRTVVNYGKDAGEAVPHLHIHILAGRELGWPPG